MTPSGEVRCVLGGGGGDAAAAVAVDVALLLGLTHAAMPSACHGAGRALTLTSATAVIGLLGEDANTYAVILGLDPRTHSSALPVPFRGAEGRGLRCGGGWGGLAW
ncbi:MAG: hypothetical protein CL627_02545, partial [Aurantimonas sp.]|nr:hypothetical protein [Aurantimonas sp.]